jgi:frizzled protein 6
VLQESCEFFLKHNSKVKHKKKHYKPSSHKLKVISKSMGTSTGATANHGTSAVAITEHDYLGQETLTEIQTSPEASVREARTDRASTPKLREQDRGEPASPAASSSKLSGEQTDRKSQVGSVKDKSSVSEGARSEGR